MRKILAGALAALLLPTACGSPAKPSPAYPAQPPPMTQPGYPYAPPPNYTQPPNYVPPQNQPPANPQGQIPVWTIPGFPPFPGFPPPPQPGNGSAQAGANPADPFGILAQFPGAVGQAQAVIATLPCPMPGLPPELARLVDCTVLRGAASATKLPPIPVGMLPGTVDQRMSGLIGPVRDQGQVGSCSANAIAAILDTVARKAGRGDLGSAMHLFASYQDPSNRRGLDAVVRATTSDAVWPYDGARACAFEDDADRPSCASFYKTDGSSGFRNGYAQAERARADATPVFRVTGIESLGDTLDFNQVAARLAQNEPLYIGVTMPMSWTSSQLPAGTSVAPPPRGVLGPHAMVLRGYRYGTQGREFLIQNSWGTRWADGGFLWVNEAVLASIVINQEIYRIPGTIL